MKRVVVIQVDKQLQDKEIDDAIEGMPNYTYNALVQLINRYAQEYAMAAPQSAGSNNALGMARDTGGYEALVNLVIQLDNRRTTSSEE